MNRYLEAIHVSIGCVLNTDDVDQETKERVLKNMETIERTLTEVTERGTHEQIR